MGLEIIILKSKRERNDITYTGNLKHDTEKHIYEKETNS